MIDLTRHLFTSAIRAQFLGAQEAGAIEYEGFCSHVFEVGSGKRRDILKISHSSRVSFPELATELSFTNHLALRGVPICAPVTLPEEILRVADGAGGEFFGYRYEKVPGESFREAEKTDASLRAAGRALAELHVASTSFSQSKATRLDFLSREFVNYRKYVRAEEAGVLSRFDEIKARLQSLPRGKDTFGLCHGDAHDGNFLLAPANEIHLIDFDDVEFGFFVNDFAVLLDSCVDGDGKATPAFAVHAFSELYRGYRGVREFSAAELSWIPLFVKFRWVMQHTLHAFLLGDRAPTEKQARSRDRRIALIESDFADFDFLLRLDFAQIADSL